MPKNIVLCCDGTGNEINENLSNVLKLFRVLRKNEDQVVFYDPGVGTISSSDAWSRLKSNALGVLGLATGYGLDENVLDAYRFLVDTYRDGDQIFMFGFSRGAYTIRVLAGFLRLIGLVQQPQRNLCEYGLTAYKRAAEKNNFEIAWRFERVGATRRVPIKFIGVWDTVSSVIVPRPDRLYLPSLQELPYTRTNSYVEVFRQAVAIDERRRMFRINRWAEPQDYKPNPFDPDGVTPQDIKQVWFSGVHADIGGGYPEIESGPAKYPLSWLIDEAVHYGLQINISMYNHLVLGHARKGASRSYAVPSVGARLHNSMNFGWLLLEGIPKRTKGRDWPKRRSLLGWYLPLREPRRIDNGARVHHSVFDRIDQDPSYRPVNLPPKEMVQIEGRSIVQIEGPSTLYQREPTVKVTMLLTDRDAENAESILAATQARSKAHALSIALTLTRFVINKLLGGADIVIRERDGHLEPIVIRELETSLLPMPNAIPSDSVTAATAQRRS